ncbi:MAG: hypothetical protein ACREXW_18905, partial [Gammaproteobacteria bacterium]
SPSGVRLFAKTHYTAKCRPLPSLFPIMRSVILLKDWISPVVIVQRDTTNSLQPCILRHFLTIRVDFYATGG